MSFPWFIARRYLTAKRKQAFISLISLVSVLGVTVGVMALVIANALMTGVQGEMRDRIVGATAHINVYKPGPGLLDVEAELAKMTGAGIQAAAPISIGKGMLVAGQRSAFAQLKGIEPSREVLVTDLGGSMLAGTPEALTMAPGWRDDVERPTDPLLLGSGLAETLGVRVGDLVDLMVPTGVLTPLGAVPRARTFVVAGIFQLGFFEFDTNYALLPLEISMDLLNEPAPAAIQLRVDDLDAAPAIGAALRQRLGAAYVVVDWTEMNAGLYSALRLEKLAISFTIGLIVMVAALNIVGSLILLVMEKSRDIGILRTMGASASAIQWIFILQGATIGAVGVVSGAVLGVVVSWLCDYYQLFSLPGDVYQITQLHFRVEVLDVLIVVIGAWLVCLLATIYPARRASALDPAEALRYQ
jgi:lipoprotein-releasing system permease protein